MIQLRSMMETCCQVYVETNPHKASYQTLGDYMNDNPDMLADLIGDLTDENVLYVLQVYPDTPLGFFRACGHDLDRLVDAIASQIGDRQ